VASKVVYQERDDGKTDVVVNGAVVGQVWPVSDDKKFWQHSENPYPRAYFFGRWRAKNKLLDKLERGRGYMDTIAQLNGR
jgi:hypothetical protein